MEVKLKHITTEKGITEALLIKGENPRDWLSELSRLNLSPKEVRLFVLPKSKKDIKAWGLFVALSPGVIKADIDGALIKYKKQGKIYVPLNAELYPKLTVEEFQKVPLYDFQVFHPTIGLVGFDGKEALNFSSLIEFETQLDSQWRSLDSKYIPPSKLQFISMVQPSQDELLQELSKKIGSKPLDDLRENQPKNNVSKIGNKIKTAFFKALKKGIEGLGTSDSEGTNDGPIDKLYTWASQNLEDLEEKRKGELDKLMDMFDDDMDEALQFAIPINSDELGRGTAEPSWQLGRRDANFSLFGSSSTGAVDNWDIGDDYNYRLKQKYLKAAEKAIEKGDFKKAAYIYSKLLNDYYKAAETLKNGELFMEAAILYKDKLDNNPMAAECFEKAGMYKEAIELYIKLKNTEKVGDLYREVGNEEKASFYYQAIRAQFLKKIDYLNAGRISEEKLGDVSKAKNDLLIGWGNSQNSDACLEKYFELTEDEELTQEIELIGNKYVSNQLRYDYLKILVGVFRKRANSNQKDQIMSQVYEMSSKDALEGKHRTLGLLKNFLESDNYISKDISRFSYLKSDYSPKHEERKGFSLGSDYNWLSVTRLGNYYLAIGKTDCLVKAVRFDRAGNQQSFQWESKVSRQELSPHFIPGRGVAFGRVDGTFFPENTFQSDKYFSIPMTVGTPEFFNRSFLCITGSNEDSGLRSDYIGLVGINDDVEIVSVDYKGSVISSVIVENSEVESMLPLEIQKAYLVNDKLLTAQGRSLILANQDTVLEMSVQSAPIDDLVLSYPTAHPYVLFRKEEQLWIHKLSDDKFVDASEQVKLPTNEVVLGFGFITLSTAFAFTETEILVFGCNTPFNVHSRISTEDPIVSVFAITSKKIGVLFQGGVIAEYNC